MKMEAPRRSQRLMMKRDRLSDLPNAILLHIMSFLFIKDAVKTCILSKQWKDLWKSLPNLTLHTYDFITPAVFSEFVSGIVSRRSGNHPLHKLDFNRHGYLRPQIFTNLMRHVVFHNVQQLRIVVPYNIGLPNCIFSCRSLTSLHISVSRYDDKRRSRVPRSLELPTLISLHLEGIAITTDNNGHAEPFSKCNKLNTLCIDNCFLFKPNSPSSVKSGILSITNATLVNLTIDDTDCFYRIVIPVPTHKTVISAPKLSSFTLNGAPFQTLVGQEGVKVELQSSSLV